jgi:hypothetical protein
VIVRTGQSLFKNHPGIKTNICMGVFSQSAIIAKKSKLNL